MPEKNRKNKTAPDGLGVDSPGAPVIDPTFNVLQLVKAAMKRQDDLRKADRRDFKGKLKAERRRINEQLRLRAKYDRWLIKAEAGRIDAIRTVDVNYASANASKIAAQVEVSAHQVSSTAETLRTLVTTTANALAEQHRQISEPLLQRVAQLEKAQYEGAGKERVIDPLVNQVLLEVKALREGDKARKGQSMGLAQALGWIVAAITILGFVLNKLK